MLPELPGRERATGRFDTPYDRLEPLPREGWLPVLTAAAGTREQQLDHGRHWLDARHQGTLTEAHAYFGEPDATLARGVPTLAEQVLRTLLWHLDLIPDLRPRLDRAAAVAQAVDAFREAWRVDTAGLDDEMVWLRDLADGAVLLIVSDGEFGCVPATLQGLDEARANLGLAEHGILVDDRETMGLLEVCDAIHWVRDWRRHVDAAEGADATPGGNPQRLRPETLLAKPVHSKSLTALYFPNALSSARAARHRPG